MGGIKLTFKFGYSSWWHELYILCTIHKLACYWVARQVFCISLIKIKKVKLTLAIFHCTTTLYIGYCNARIVFCYEFHCIFYLETTSAIQDQDILVENLQMVLQDNSFKVNLPVTIRTRNATKKFLIYSVIKTISCRAILQLKDILQMVIERRSPKLSFNYNWKNCGSTITCWAHQNFTKLWKYFLPSIEPSVEVVLYQHLTWVLYQHLTDQVFNTERFCQSRGVDGEIQAE